MTDIRENKVMMKPVDVSKKKNKLIIFLEAYRVRLEEPRDNSDARVVLL